MTDMGAHAWRLGEPDPIVAGTAGSVMSTSILTTDVNTSVDEALRLMRHHDVHHLLLEDRGRIVAVVSDRDLVRQGMRLTSSEDERKALRPVFQVAHYHLVSAPQSEPIVEVARTMLRDGISSLPILNEAGEIAGILTSRDLLRYLAFGHVRQLWSEAS